MSLLAIKTKSESTRKGLKYVARVRPLFHFNCSNSNQKLRFVFSSHSLFSIFWKCVPIPIRMFRYISIFRLVWLCSYALREWFQIGFIFSRTPASALSARLVPVNLFPFATIFFTGVRLDLLLCSSCFFLLFSSIREWKNGTKNHALFSQFMFFQYFQSDVCLFLFCSHLFIYLLKPDSSFFSQFYPYHFCCCSFYYFIIPSPSPACACYCVSGRRCVEWEARTPHLQRAFFCAARFYHVVVAPFCYENAVCLLHDFVLLSCFQCLSFRVFRTVCCVCVSKFGDLCHCRTTTTTPKKLQTYTRHGTRAYISQCCTSFSWRKV